MLLLILLSLLSVLIPTNGQILTTACSNAVSAWFSAVDISNCPNIATIFTNPLQFAACASNANNVNCMDPYSVMGFTNSKIEESQIYMPYELSVPTSAVPCPLCDASVTSTCGIIMESMRDYVLRGSSDLYSSLVIPNPSNFQTATTNLIQYCAPSYTDTVKISYVTDQSQIFCNSNNSYGYAVSGSKISGALDMRSLLQCGTCSMVPCLPGQLCLQNEIPTACPEGSYCPNTYTKIICPRGHFCPKSSTAPIPCRKMAAGSCASEGSTREIVWVPLFISMLIYLIICALHTDSLCPLWLRKIRGFKNLQEKAEAERATSPISALFSTYFESFLTAVHEFFTPKISTLDRYSSVSSVSIHFEDLEMVTNKTRRLHKVTGVIQANRFTAILGGSGAGKTSLMNSLLAREEITGGSIQFLQENKIRLSQSTVNRIVGFVPQNDVLIRSLTVEQALIHSAKTRLPISTSHAEVLRRVDDVLEKLDLTEKRDIIIGGDNDTEGIGLSMGDRKKVNIAVELVADPKVLFLDEPTTSIDASSAIKIVKILHRLSMMGITIIAVIHQPRGEIFNYIDDLLLMVPGGKVGYQGPMKLVIGWFNALGYKPHSERDNKTDFLLDVTCGKNIKQFKIQSAEIQVKMSNFEIDSSGKPEADEPSNSETVDWASLWTQSGDKYLQDNGMLSSNETGEISNEVLDISNEVLDWISSQLFLIYAHFHRGVLQRIKSTNLFSFLTIHLLGGVIIGIVSCGGPLLILPISPTYKLSCPPGTEMTCRLWQRFEVGPASFLLALVIGCITIPAAVNCFGREKEIFLREAAVGVSATSYFIGKLFSDIPFVCLSTFMYISPVLAIAPWSSPVGKFYLVYLLLSIFVTSFGYVLTFLLSNPDDATLAGAIITILFNLFGGFVPKLGDGIMGTISFTHYVSKALATIELMDGLGNDEAMYNILVPLPWRGPNWRKDLTVVVIIFIVTYFVAFIFFKYQLRVIKS